MDPVKDFDLLQQGLLVSFTFPNDPETYTGRVKDVERMTRLNQRRVYTVVIEYKGKARGMNEVRRTPGLITQIREYCPICKAEVFGNNCELCNLQMEIDALVKLDVEMKGQIKLFYELEEEDEGQVDRNELFLLNQSWRENKTKLEQVRERYAERKARGKQ